MALVMQPLMKKEDRERTEIKQNSEKEAKYLNSISVKKIYKEPLST